MRTTIQDLTNLAQLRPIFWISSKIFSKFVSFDWWFADGQPLLKQGVNMELNHSTSFNELLRDRSKRGILDEVNFPQRTTLED